MACTTDPITAREQESIDVAQMLIYAKTSTGEEPSDQIKRATTGFGNPSILDEMTAELCDIVRHLSPAEMETIVYARTPLARKLANWWEAHEKADKDRAQREADHVAAVKLTTEILDTLTPAQRKMVVDTIKYGHVK